MLWLSLTRKSGSSNFRERRELDWVRQMDTEFTEPCKKIDQTECNSQKQKPSKFKKQRETIYMALYLSVERRHCKTNRLKIGWAKDPVKWLNEVSGIERHWREPQTIHYVCCAALWSFTTTFPNDISNFRRQKKKREWGVVSGLTL